MSWNNRFPMLAAEAALLSSFLVWAPAASAQALTPGVVNMATYDSPGGGSVPYWLFVPQGYDPAKKYPLVLVLHHAGENGTNGEHLDALHPYDTDVQAKYPSFVLAPQSPCSYYCWGGAPADWGKDPQEPHGRMAVELIKKLEGELSIDTKRLYLSGESMGSWGVWDVAMRNPDMFAAVLGMDGAPDAARAEKILNMASWNCEGEEDMTMYGVDVGQVVQARAFRDRMLGLAAKNYKYQEFPGGHGNGYGCRDDSTMPDWMFSQVKGGAPASGTGTGGAAGTGGGASTGGNGNLPVGTGGAGTGGSGVAATGGRATGAGGTRSNGTGGAKPAATTGGSTASGGAASSDSDSPSTRSSCSLSEARPRASFGWAALGLSLLGASLKRRRT